MAIRDRQYQKEIARVMEKELKEGRYPELTYVQQVVAEKFKKREAGMPRFELKPVANKQVSSAEDYNKMVEAVYEDLDTSFEEVKHQGDRMMALADYYETEKFRIHLQTKKLNRRMELLVDMLENRGLREVIFDTFHDFIGVEFNGDRARNLPATNTFIDLRHGWAGLEEIKAGSKKVNLATAHASVKPISQFEDFVQLSNINNCLKDTINESWRHRAIMKTPGEGVIRYRIDLAEESLLTMVSFTPQSARPTTIVLRTSSDGENFEEHLPKEVSELTEWNFEAKTVKTIEFQMKKSEPDIAIGAEYHYYFGAENIGARKVMFTKEGRLVSKPHRIGRVIDKLVLKVDEMIPPGTDIDYFVAEDHQNGSILEWETIEPGKSVFFGSMAEDEITVDSTEPFYGDFYDSLYNHDYFSIIQLTKKPAARTIDILVGESMYQVDSMPAPTEGLQTPTLDSWKNAREYETSFISLANASSPNNMAVDANRLERMTTHITMAKDYTLYANPLDVGPNIRVAVYLNNMEIRPINGDYTYQFKKGVNKLEVLYVTTGASSIAPNLSQVYLESIGATEIYAQGASLQQVELYDLMNNTSKKDYSKFAVDADNKIVLNYDPRAFDKAGEGVQYKMRYRYPRDESQTETFVRFMAKLYLTDSKGDVSPILKSYKLIVE